MTPQAQKLARADAAVAAGAEHARRDPQRPAYHFMPRANWINDPNGMIRWRGTYHLFYQHNPFEPRHGPMYWGHATSTDLVRWTHLPIALAPEDNGPDKDGCWSGCAVDNDGVPTLIYTGVHPQVQCVVTADETLTTFTRHPGNPVIREAPPGFDAGFRDPHVWQEKDGWYMAVGSGAVGKGGAVLLYHSADLVTWQYLHPLLEGKAWETGRMWECPFFFPLEDQWVLIVHPIPMSRALWFAGDYRDHKFTPRTQGTLDFGIPDFFAVHIVGDGEGRTLMTAWLREARPQAQANAAGWNGLLTLPREMALSERGELMQKPIDAMSTLRGSHESNRDVELIRPDRYTLDANLRGNCLEIAFRATLHVAGRIGLRVLRSHDGREETNIVYDSSLKVLMVDRQRSSLDATHDRSTVFCPMVLSENEALELRVFVDRSVIEIFANGGKTISCRAYPTLTDATGVQAWTGSTHATVHQFDLWQMHGIE